MSQEAQALKKELARIRAKNRTLTKLMDLAREDALLGWTVAPKRVYRIVGERDGWAVTFAKPGDDGQVKYVSLQSESARFGYTMDLLILKDEIEFERKRGGRWWFQTAIWSPQSGLSQWEDIEDPV